MVYSLEGKKAIRRVKRVGNAHIFEAAISRASAQRRLIDEFLSLSGGRSQPVMIRILADHLWQSTVVAFAGSGRGL